MHVQCTCKCFVPVVLLPPLQAKRWPPLMPNLQVTCMLHQPIFFVVTVRVGCRLRAPGPEKFIREGSSGSRKF